MLDSDFVALVYCDLVSVLRGRAMPGGRFKSGASIGWVPSAFARPPFGPSIKPNPFGSMGDLQLVADARTRTTLPVPAGQTTWDVTLCDLCLPDRTPWECCPRHLLRGAIEDLAAETGSRPLVSFEMEFTLLPVPDPSPPPLSLAAMRSVEPFPKRLCEALGAAGIAAEAFIAESGAGQFEVPVPPAFGIEAADRAVVTRELVRSAAVVDARRATFAPMLGPRLPGNGVHIHISLIDESGTNLFEAFGGEHKLSPIGRWFAGGVLHHAAALVAITSPSPISAARLRPGQRSAAQIALAESDREAILRIPAELAEPSASDGIRLEYRAADATSNPYLALAVLLRAGTDGIVHQREPSTLGGGLPATLSDAILALSENEVANSWLPPVLVETHLAIKNHEMIAAEGDEDLAATCRRYADIY